MVVAPKENGFFTIHDLKEAVEWTLQDKLPGFRQFLEVDCGSFLNLVDVSVLKPFANRSWCTKLSHEC